MLLGLCQEVDRRQLDVRLGRRLEERAVRLEELVEFVGEGLGDRDRGCGWNVLPPRAEDSRLGKGHGLWRDDGMGDRTYPRRGAGPVSSPFPVRREWHVSMRYRPRVAVRQASSGRPSWSIQRPPISERPRPTQYTRHSPRRPCSRRARPPWSVPSSRPIRAHARSCRAQRGRRLWSTCRGGPCP